MLKKIFEDFNYSLCALEVVEIYAIYVLLSNINTLLIDKRNSLVVALIVFNTFLIRKELENEQVIR
ncbi:MAG: hypothetical protein QXG00_07835 [Candidatus Woesearchaeota archaeon]